MGNEKGHKHKLNLKESTDYLNTVCGYIDVENDEDYSSKDIIKIANLKWRNENDQRI